MDCNHTHCFGPCSLDGEPEVSGLSQMLQLWLDAEQESLSFGGTAREYLPEGECQGRMVDPYAPSPAATRPPSPSPATMPPTSDPPHFSSDSSPPSEFLPPTPEEEDYNMTSESRAPSPVPEGEDPATPFSGSPSPSFPPTPEDDDYSMSYESEDESRASSPAPEEDEPEWLPVTTVMQYTWAGRILPPMSADSLWDHLKKEEAVLQNSRADGCVKCRWPGCGKFRPRNDLRRHVRFTHQRIKKCCTNPGCDTVHREDNFNYRHKKCQHGPAGASELLIAPPDSE